MLVLPVVLAALCASVAPAPPQSLPGDEGALNNDCFLPTSRAAQEHLARADQVFARLTGSDSWAADPERAWIEVFEGWRAALTDSENGAAVPPRPAGGTVDEISPWPDPDGTAERRSDGVEQAVIRRLEALAAGTRASWTERFETLAGTALEAAGSSAEPLAEVERLHPATQAAAVASLRLFDQAFEQARPLLARSWLARCERHLALIGEQHTPRWSERITARRRALTGWMAEERPSAEADKAWKRATKLRPIAVAAIADRRRRASTSPRARTAAPAPGVGVQPGLCFLEDGTAAIQTAERVLLVEPDEGVRVGQFAPSALIEKVHWATPEVAAPITEPPGWPLLPATDGRAIVLVQGRASGRQCNALLCIDMEESPEPLSESAGLRLPRLRWALTRDLRYDGEGAPVLGELGLENPEFQPGPIVVGSQVLVQVRERPEGATLDFFTGRLPTDDEIRCWLVAIDLATGKVRWKRFLAKGVPISRQSGRFGVASLAVSSAQPLTSSSHWIFAGTHVGAGALLDVADGRLAWCLKNRRRAAQVTGWSGARPLVDRDAGVLLWAPADGDHAYWLRARPASAGPLLSPPRAQGEAVALIGGGAKEALVLSRSGRERTLTSWSAKSGGSFDAPYLGPGELFTGGGLASEARALFATGQGLYLLDRERELYLLDYAPLQLQGDPGPAGGSVFARGERVYVLGPTTVWIFAAT